MTVARSRRIGGAAELEVLHAIEEAGELFGKGIAIEAGLRECEQRFMGGFKR